MRGGTRLPDLVQNRPDSKGLRQRQDLLVALAALKHTLGSCGNWPPAQLIKRRPQQAWGVRCCLLRACDAADRAGSDAAEMCDYLVASRNLLAYMPLIELLTTIDVAAVPPEHTDSVVVDITAILDRRRLLRQAKPESQTGPPRPEMQRPAGESGAAAPTEVGNCLWTDNSQHSETVHGAQQAPRRGRAP
jgi:hypothetical protein